MIGKGLQVLHDSCEVELVARAGEPPEAQALEAMMGLQVRKPHLDPLAFVARFVELRRPPQRPRMIAGILVYVACDLARWRMWTALRLEWTCVAVELGRKVAQRVVVTDTAC